MAGLAIGGIASILSGLFGNRPSTVKTTFDNTTENQGSQNTSQAGYSTPQLDPMTGILQKYLINSILERGLNVDKEAESYKTGALENINQGADIKRQLMQNTLASRGLQYSPNATNAYNNLDSERVNQGTTVMNQMPLIKNQLFADILKNALGVFSAQPVGQSYQNQNDTSMYGKTHATGSGTQAQPGNMLGGFMTGLGSAATSGGLDWLFPKKSGGSNGDNGAN
jgi:hypothetical protein